MNLSDAMAALREFWREFSAAAVGGPSVQRHPQTALFVNQSSPIVLIDKFKVPRKQKDEVLAAASSLKKDIVEQP